MMSCCEKQRSSKPLGPIQVLCWGKGKTVTIYMDRWYAYTTLYVHRVLHSKRVSSSQPEKKSRREEILALLEAPWFPREAAIVHCKGHQQGEFSEVQGNYGSRLVRPEGSPRGFSRFWFLCLNLDCCTVTNLHKTREDAKQEAKGC